jgi:tetratricopeptide (TPR) repeat protein
VAVVVVPGGYVTPELEMLGLVLPLFPSLQALPPAEQAARTEALGVFLANGWNVGPARLRQIGFDLPPEVVSGLLPAAQRVAQAKRGGATFLVHLRQALNDDARFQRQVVTLGSLYARSRSKATSAGLATSSSLPAMPGLSTSGSLPAITPEQLAEAAPAPAARSPGLHGAKTTSSRPAFTMDALDSLDFSGQVTPESAPAAPAAPAPAATAEVPDAGERTGGFDARMLADLETTLKSSSQGHRAPTPAPPPPAAARVPAPPPPPPPRPAAAAPAQAGAPDDFLASLVGGGLADEALAPPAPAPPPRPTTTPPGGVARPPAGSASGLRPAAPPPPSGPVPAVKPAAPAKDWSSFEQALASGGPIFKDEDEAPAAPPVPAAPPARAPAPPPPRPAPAPPPRPAPVAPPSASESLDLLPEPEAAPQPPSDDAMDKLLAEAAPPPVKVNEPVKKPKMTNFKSTTVRVQEFSFETNDDWGNAPGADAKDDDPAVEAPLPKDPAQAALVRFERTGDTAALAEARRIFMETIAAAPHGTARAYAEAGLAKVQLLAGNAQQADAQARAALDRDPGNPFAVEVMVRIGRGDAERSRLTAGLTQARNLIAGGRGADARRLLEGKLAVEHPDSPHPWLIAALLAKLEGDDPRFEQCIAQAWQRYPPKKHGDVPLGGTVDVDVANILAMHGRARFKTLDPEFLRRTVENVDAKDNLVAGAFRLAIACGRMGIARGQLTRKSTRKAWIAIAGGLIGLQYYDAAVEALDRAVALRPDEAEAKIIDVERRFAGQMRRAFDKPGVKAQLGKYTCLGVQAISGAARDRMAAAAKDRASCEADLLRSADEVARLVMSDAKISEEVRSAAEELGCPDPLAPIEAVDGELAQVRDERARLADPVAKAAPEKKGFLSKLAGAASAAADKVANAAKDAQLKVREIALIARRDDAVRRLAVTMAKELRDHAWNTPQLKTFTRRAAILEAFSDYHAEEERLAKAEFEAISKSI